jgi:hypothetical protein
MLVLMNKNVIFECHRIYFQIKSTSIFSELPYLCFLVLFKDALFHSKIFERMRSFISCIRLKYPLYIVFVWIYDTNHINILTAIDQLLGSFDKGMDQQCLPMQTINLKS